MVAVGVNLLHAFGRRREASAQSVTIIQSSNAREAVVLEQRVNTPESPEVLHVVLAKHGVAYGVSARNKTEVR